MRITITLTKLTEKLAKACAEKRGASLSGAINHLIERGASK